MGRAGLYVGLLLLTEIVRILWSVTLEWTEFGCVHKLYPEVPHFVGLGLPAVRRPKLVIETDLIVRQYDRLSQQQLSFLLLELINRSVFVVYFLVLILNVTLF